MEKESTLISLKEKYQEMTVQKSQLHNQFSSLEKTIELEKK